MALEDRRSQHDQQLVGKYKDPYDSYIMTPRDYVVRPYADGNTGPVYVVLPPVDQAKGRFYTIIARHADGINHITILDRRDSECWKGNIELHQACQGVGLYSDGFAWIAMPKDWLGIPHTMHPATVAPTTLAPTQAPTTIGPTTLRGSTTLAPTTIVTTIGPTTTI